MQVTTDLRPMFSYSFIPIIIVIILLVVVVFLIKYKKKKGYEEPLVIIPKPKDLNEIKKRYLLQIEELSNLFQSNKISNRLAYQRLSNLIRNFIYESTNIKVQNYTLSEIQKIDLPILYELVSEYYDPEFSVISEGNIAISIDKTKRVIEKWN